MEVSQTQGEQGTSMAEKKWLLTFFRVTMDLSRSVWHDTSVFSKGKDTLFFMPNGKQGNLPQALRKIITSWYRLICKMHLDLIVLYGI